MLLSPCTSKPKIFNRKGRRERKGIRMSKCELRMLIFKLRKSPFEGGFMAKAIPSGGGCYCPREHQNRKFLTAKDAENAKKYECRSAKCEVRITNVDFQIKKVPL